MVGPGRLCVPLLVCYNLFKGIYDTNCKAHTLRDTWAGTGFLDWLGIFAGPIILLSALLVFIGVSAIVAISMLLWSMSETIYPKKE